MQSKSSTHTPRPLSRLGREADTVFSWIARSIKTPLQFLSFWGAIGLPFANLGLLMQGLESLGAVALFCGLLALNVVALYVGRDYNQ